MVALWFTPPLCRGSVPSDAARVSGPRIEPPKEAGGEPRPYTYRGDTESGPRHLATVSVPCLSR